MTYLVIFSSSCKICNPELVEDNIDATFSLEKGYLTDIEEECSSGTESEEMDVESRDEDPRGVEVEYGRQRREIRQHRKKSKIRMPKSKVVMPTGREVRITSPTKPKWKCGFKPRLITLSPRGGMGRREYAIVASEMQNTILDHSYCATAGGCFKEYNIIKIQKIVNGCAWRRYQNRKADVAVEAGSANELMLFHGSPSVDTVVARGFDERFTKDGKLGAGIYFAQNSSVANQFVFGFFGGTGCPKHNDKNCFECERCILLCRVTLGRVSEFNFSSMGQMSHPPPEYDSVKGVPGEGGFEYPEYVVYRGEQAYPEYLITYKIAEPKSDVEQKYFQ